MTDRQSESSSLERALASLLGAYAQELWAAGLGAFATAEKSGGHLLRALLATGQGVEAGARRSVKRGLGQAGSVLCSAASGAGATAERLEQMFEHRVAKALNALQIPTAADVKALAARVEKLNLAVEELARSVPEPAGTRGTGKPRASTKSGARKTRRKKRPAAAPARGNGKSGV